MSVAARESFFKIIWQSCEPLLLLHTLHTDQSVNLSIFFMIVFFMIVDQNWLFFGCQSNILISLLLPMFQRIQYHMYTILAISEVKQ